MIPVGERDQRASLGRACLFHVAIGRNFLGPCCELVHQRRQLVRWKRSREVRRSVQIQFESTREFLTSVSNGRATLARRDEKAMKKNYRPFGQTIDPKLGNLGLCVSWSVDLIKEV